MTAIPPGRRVGYQYSTGGDACPGHPSKWLICDPPTRCPSRIAHESGAVARCLDTPGHLGLHYVPHERWSDDDDRILLETIPQVQAARAEREFAVCRQPNDDRAVAARVGYEQAISTLRDVAERTGSPAARWAADYLTADPDRRAPAAIEAGRG